MPTDNRKATALPSEIQAAAPPLSHVLIEEGDDAMSRAARFRQADFPKCNQPIWLDRASFDWTSFANRAFVATSRPATPGLAQ